MPSPLQRYHRRIAGGELRADRAQLAAVRELEKLHRQIAAGRIGGRFVGGRLGRLINRREPRRGIYLWGGVGSGKTMLMDLLHRSLIENGGGENENGGGKTNGANNAGQLSKRIHFHRFMQSAHEAKRRLPDRQDPLAVIAAQWAARHRVLCLDEFSVTDITDAMLLSGLLRGLFAAGVTVVATSNTRPDDLYAGGLQRQRFLPAIALIKSRMKVARVDGGRDYRMDFLAAEALYHTPHDDRARRELWRSFMRLEGGAGDDKDHLQLAGRAVAIVAAGRGTAWFRFGELCGAGRSKRDYIELSKRFHTLILSDIPRLDSDADDAARRLIELVDELYDRGVNLIASAAAAPDDLYAGRRLRQPFARAASRLREMNSRAYLARAHLG